MILVKSLAFTLTLPSTDFSINAEDSTDDNAPNATITPTLQIARPSDLPTATSAVDLLDANDLGLPSWATVDFWLSIPAIDLEAPIMAFDTRVHHDEGEESIRRLPVAHAYLASWDTSSATPGFNGNAIMTGHNNLWGAVFKYIGDLQSGDEINIWTPSGVFTYYVQEVTILEEKGQPLEVRLDNARYLQASSDQRLTLITCYPRNGSTHRLVVVATR